MTALFVIPPSFLVHFLIFWPRIISGLSCSFPSPDLESAIFPRIPGSFNRRVVFRNQNPDIVCAHCSWGTFLLCIFRVQKPRVITLILPHPIQTHRPHPIFLNYIFVSPFSEWKTCLLFPQSFYYVISLRKWFQNCLFMLLS